MITYKRIGDRRERENYSPTYAAFADGEWLGVITRSGSRSGGTWKGPWQLRDHPEAGTFPSRRAAVEALRPNNPQE